MAVTGMLHCGISGALPLSRPTAGSPIAAWSAGRAPDAVGGPEMSREPENSLDGRRAAPKITRREERAR